MVLVDSGAINCFVYQHVVWQCLLVQIWVPDMAVTLGDGSIVHNSSAVDIPIRLFRQSGSLDLSVRCHVLDHLSSYFVFGMD